jgi:hypothetical protein
MMTSLLPSTRLRLWRNLLSKTCLGQSRSNSLPLEASTSQFLSTRAYHAYTASTLARKSALLPVLAIRRVSATTTRIIATARTASFPVSASTSVPGCRFRLHSVALTTALTKTVSRLLTSNLRRRTSTPSVLGRLKKVLESKQGKRSGLMKK